MRKITSFILLLAALTFAGEVKEFTCEATEPDGDWSYNAVMIYHDGVLSGSIVIYGSDMHAPLDIGQWYVPSTITLESARTYLRIDETETEVNTVIDVMSDGKQMFYTKFSMFVSEGLLNIARHKDKPSSKYMTYEDDGLDCINISTTERIWSQARRLK